jgi:hypothetical protein
VNEVWADRLRPSCALDLPMPEQISWETDSIEKPETFEFDDPATGVVSATQATTDRRCRRRFQRVPWVEAIEKPADFGVRSMTRSASV